MDTDGLRAVLLAVQRLWERLHHSQPWHLQHHQRARIHGIREEHRGKVSDDAEIVGIILGVFVILCKQAVSITGEAATNTGQPDV